MIKKFWNFLRSPTAKYSAGLLLGVGVFAGIIFWGGFNTIVEATNTEEFCISCHEMQENVYLEYKETIHYSNKTGVRAICSDCHVPKTWIHKMARKIQATNEVFHKILGTIDTPEKFNEHRLEMASRVWKVMKETDSRECRNCHNFNYMNMEDQDKTARKKHTKAFNEGKTCIDCHQGIAHELPDDENDDNYEKAISQK
jgi:cytochrome c-type protein NapC